jgi:hypothetical protein
MRSSDAAGVWDPTQRELTEVGHRAVTRLTGALVASVKHAAWVGFHSHVA